MDQALHASNESRPWRRLVLSGAAALVVRLLPAMLAPTAERWVQEVEAQEEVWATDVYVDPVPGRSGDAPRPVKNQKRAPCTEGLEVEVSGACWLPIEKRPCPPQTRAYQDQCLLPVAMPRPLSALANTSKMLCGALGCMILRSKYSHIHRGTRMSCLSDVSGSTCARLSAIGMLLFLMACGASEPTTSESALASTSAASTTETELGYQLQNNVVEYGFLYPYGESTDSVYFLEVPAGTQYLKFSAARRVNCTSGKCFLAMDVGFDSIPAGTSYDYCNVYTNQCDYVVENPAAGVWWVRVGIDDRFYCYADTEFTLKGAYGGTEVLGIQAGDEDSGPRQLCLPD
ncbi:hypothetical protein JRI60_36080 [Archangium violaceum]|uniref:hypothetical protein n=1 Tax=Archangium violaceum TaxID=83451 RepID=UPI00194E87A5|nr:hypothetical protein [Archangium violaceum]QRN94510.1 hypothetical protein JRI60_36080 [Archangium violaceum]